MKLTAADLMTELDREDPKERYLNEIRGEINAIEGRDMSKTVASKAIKLLIAGDHVKQSEYKYNEGYKYTFLNHCYVSHTRSKQGIEANKERYERAKAQKAAEKAEKLLRYIMMCLPWTKDHRRAA